MALPMARPWKHPKTGIYWLRKRVPDTLRPIVGKLEEKQSLKTRDPAEAKKLFAQALAALEAKWANLRAPPQSITEKQAHEFVAPVYSWWLDQFRDNPSEQRIWKTELSNRLWAPPSIWEPIDITKVDPESISVFQMEQFCRDRTKEIIAQTGLIFDDLSKSKIEKAVGAALQRASLLLQKMDKGDLIEVNQSEIENEFGQAKATTKISFDGLLEGWAKERKPTQKTIYETKRTLKDLKAFLGFDDARKVTSKDLIAWKDKMLEKGLQPRTIRSAKLAAIKSLLQWAVSNGRIPTNPAAKVTVGLKTKAGGTKRGFTEEEAATILKAAKAETNPVKHWIPLLGAYSGARLSELCQLRTQDILEIDEIWCLKIAPEAGSLKTTSSERIIPLHPAIIEVGFLNYVKRLPKGPLFPDLPPDLFGKRGGNATKTLGRWVRSLGLTDPRLSPSHSWRHRFKTMCRRFEVAPDISDALTGHYRKTVAASYGEFPVEALHRELCRIPKVEV
jgi:integrase